ncbi:MAG: arginine--tRNA ligase [Rickettsiales bacterium]|nr:arginine--tRNA ligase [Rickettsiales bacterium]
MNFFKELKKELNLIIEEYAKLPAAELPLDAITVEPPRDPSHGDVSTNAAMVLTKALKQKPRDIAEALAEPIRALPEVEAVEIAGPGFINIRFSLNRWRKMIPVVLAEGTGFGNTDIGNGEKVNVEYVSANPTGPLHVGHARGAVFGDALAGLLKKAGYDVTKEYYINDAGAQIDVLAHSAYLRYREASGEAIESIPEGLYPGDYLKPVGQALYKEYSDALLEQDEAEWLKKVRPFAVASMMALIRDDLAACGIEQDVFTSELALHDADKVNIAIAKLESLDLVYRGVLEPPKGKKPEDWEPREQLLFKSSEFGDDVDRPLQKSDGTSTYFASELGYIVDKLERGFETLIFIFGADHGGYKKRTEAAVRALSQQQAETDIKLCQLVHLFRDGEPVKMSKRAGNFETVRDVLNTVGKDVLRFVMLTRKNDIAMEFDLDKVQEQSKDNPVFYVQYAHARAQSLLRMAREEAPEALLLHESPEQVIGTLATEAEMNVLKVMAQWPRVVEQAAQAHEPHRVTYYLQELASAFHNLWHSGNADEGLRFIVKGQDDVTAARLALARCVAIVVASGLQVLGVEPVEELR